MDLSDAIVGSLLGTAVGDALGLPGEGLSAHRLRRMYPDVGKHHLLFGHGMVSDDTEHACMVAQALLVSAGEVGAFRRKLASELRWWLLGIPAGVGFATLRATLRLMIGVSPERSGIFSAGNGPAMRSPLLGVCYGDNPERLRELVSASTRLTHTDPKSEQGALAFALAAHFARQGRHEPAAFVRELEPILGQEGRELHTLITQAAQSVEQGQATQRFVESLGLKKGISGYIFHTVPAVLHTWWRHPTDFRLALTEVIACGGDTDTTAAILGGIVGAGVGKAGIPAEWWNGIWEWPRTMHWIEALGQQVGAAIPSGESQSPRKISRLALQGRNLVFLSVVLAHGFRRLLPPY